VAVRSSDALTQSNEAPVPDLLKANTQGFGLENLKGLRGNLPQVKVLLLETWLSRGYGPTTPLLTELIASLDNHNSVPVGFGNGNCDASGFMRLVEAFFMRNDLALKAGFTVWRCVAN
jgi:hypothetical protein